MVLALAALVLIPFGIYKIKSNAREQDRKLEELMDEMEEEEEEEEYGEDDPRRLPRQEPVKNESAVTPEGDDKTQFGNKEEEQPSIMQILEKLDEEDKNDELHVDTQKVMGTEEEEFALEPVSSELAEPTVNKD